MISYNSFIMNDRLTFLTINPGARARSSNPFFETDPELDRILTKSKLEEILSQYKDEAVHVSYRDRTGTGTSTSLRVLNNFAVEAGEDGVNIVTLYLRGYAPLFLYQSNLEKALDESSNLTGKLTAITPRGRLAA